MRSLISLLNRLTPGAREAGLGTKLADLSAQFNLLRADLARIYLENQFLLSKATLVIKAGSSPTVKSSSAIDVLAAGVRQQKSANTDMSAIAGTLATAKAALWAFYIDSAGTITTSTKTADAADAAAALELKPACPINKVELGYIIVANASGSNFTGGTTALDATDITTTYYSNPVTDDILSSDVVELS